MGGKGAGQMSAGKGGDPIDDTDPRYGNSASSLL